MKATINYRCTENSYRKIGQDHHLVLGFTPEIEQPSSSPDGSKSAPIRVAVGGTIVVTMVSHPQANDVSKRFDYDGMYEDPFEILSDVDLRPDLTAVSSESPSGPAAVGEAVNVPRLG